MSKETTSNSILRSQSGQGMIEYVLLMVVILALAAAVLTRFFMPFESWAKNYLGSYFYCLLDSGELPALGGSGGQGDCNDKFEDFTLANGRPPKVEGDSGAGSEDDGGNGRDRRRRNRGAGNVAAAPQSSRSSDMSSFGKSRGADGAGASSGVTQIPAEKSQSSGYMSFGKTTVVYVKREGERARGVTGLLLDERDRAKKREEKATVVNRSSEEGGSSNQRKPTQVSTEIKRPKKDTEISGYDFSFGGLIRMAVIIAIVALLIFLIASQINSISKSLEK